MPDQSRSVLLAERVGAKGVSLHPQSLCRLRLLPTTTPWKHDWVFRFLRQVESFTPPHTLLGPVSSAHNTTAGPVRAFADSQSEVPKKKENSTPTCPGLHQEGWGPARISVDDSCLEFGPVDFQIILRPRPGYVPKVPTTPF